MEQNYELYKERVCKSKRDTFIYLQTKQVPSYVIENCLHLIRMIPKV